MSNNFYNKYKHLFGVEQVPSKKNARRPSRNDTDNIIEKLYTKQPIDLSPNPQERIFKPAEKRAYSPLKSREFPRLSNRQYQANTFESNQNRYHLGNFQRPGFKEYSFPQNLKNEFRQNILGSRSKENGHLNQPNPYLNTKKPRSQKPSTVSNGLKKAGYRVLGNSYNFLQWNSHKEESRGPRSKVPKPQTPSQRSEPLAQSGLPRDGYHNYRNTNFDIFKNQYGRDKQTSGRSRFVTEYSKLEAPFQTVVTQEAAPLNQNLEYIRDKFVNKKRDQDLEDFEVLRPLDEKKGTKKVQEKDSLLVKLERDIRQISNGQARRTGRKTKMQVREGKIRAIQRRQRAQANLERKRKLVRLLKVEGIII